MTEQNEKQAIKEMAERMIDIQRDFNEYCAKPCRDCEMGGIVNCENHYKAGILYNAGYRKQEWISVEEKLPEIDKNGKGRYGGVRSVKVLCACKQSGGKSLVKEGYYEPCGNGSVYWRIPGSINEVTHWMPLPEPPKMKGGAE